MTTIQSIRQIPSVPFFIASVQKNWCSHCNNAYCGLDFNVMHLKLFITLVSCVGQNVYGRELFFDYLFCIVLIEEMIVICENIKFTSQDGINCITLNRVNHYRLIMLISSEIKF